MAERNPEYQAEGRRLAVLRILNEGGGRANTSEIEAGLRYVGYQRIDRELVIDDVDWMIERDLVEKDWAMETVMIVQLKRRGLRVVNGTEEVKGVKVPSVLDE